MDPQATSDGAPESPKLDKSVSTPSNERISKIACTECRRQKVKCDAHIEIPCSRCKRVKNTCEIKAPLKRVSKRKILENPQISQPKRRLEIAPSGSLNRQDIEGLLTPHVANTPISIGSTNGINAQINTDSHFQSSALPSTSQDLQVTMQTGLKNPSKTCHRTGLGLEELGMAAEIVRGDVEKSGNNPKPSSRCLDGIWVDGKAIEDIFGLYFLHYSAILPILDPTITPDAYYNQLPFLFWCIIAVGSRRYSQDPTVFLSISTRVIEMASMNITMKPMTVAVVQALLILLTWGSWDKLSSKSTYPLSGLLVHLSMHMGLHNPLSGHDFLSSRAKLSDEEKLRRGELWAHCVIVYQRSCLRIGFAPLNVPRPKSPLGVHKFLKSTSSKSLAFDLDFEVSLHDLIARASTALIENGLKFESIHQERGMCIILKIFEDQVTDLENKYSPLLDIDKLYLSLSRLMLLSMYLFQSPDNIDLTCRTRLYCCASHVIDLLNNFDKSSELINTCTTYITLGTILAATILLRFLKGSFAKYLDYDACKTSFFSALTLLKHASVENNDGPARFATRLSYCWSSDQMFHMPDGSINEELRVRSRLAMSIVYDTIWWSQEAGDKDHHRTGYAYERQLNSEGNGDVVRTPAVQEPTTAVVPSPTSFSYNSFFDDGIPLDLGLGWSLSDDIFGSWQPGFVG